MLRYYRNFESDIEVILLDCIVFFYSLYSFVIMSMHVYTVVFSKIIFFSKTGITNTSLMLVVTLLQPNGERYDKDRLNRCMLNAIAV